MTVATETAVAFQVSLHVADLARSIRFYRALLAVEPSLNAAHQARFELADPPLVLVLVPGLQTPGGSLNHVGLRLPDSAALVDVQRRLEEAGIATQRQEGIECCYARQTKFWATDPDRNLWEIYVLEADIDHSGFEDAPRPAPSPVANSVIWEHRLTEPIPARVPHADGSVDEIRLEGTLNAKNGSLAAFLADCFRVLRPGGKIVAHGLVGEQATENPKLPGLAALVQRVPGTAETLEMLHAAGFRGLFFEKLGDLTCIQVEGNELREMRLAGWRPVDAGSVRRVLYKGPLAAVATEAGLRFPRGEIVEVSEAVWQSLQAGPAAGQFQSLPADAAEKSNS